jgi:hypothetical protein
LKDLVIFFIILEFGKNFCENWNNKTLILFKDHSCVSFT